MTVCTATNHFTHLGRHENNQRLMDAPPLLGSVQGHQQLYLCIQCFFFLPQKTWTILSKHNGLFEERDKELLLRTRSVIRNIRPVLIFVISGDNIDV